MVPTRQLGLGVIVAPIVGLVAGVLPARARGADEGARGHSGLIVGEKRSHCHVASA
jgi:hypothetical protein